VVVVAVVVVAVVVVAAVVVVVFEIELESVPSHWAVELNIIKPHHTTPRCCISTTGIRVVFILVVIPPRYLS
jgi:hypothetical protein